MRNQITSHDPSPCHNDGRENQVDSNKEKKMLETNTAQNLNGQERPVYFLAQYNSEPLEQQRPLYFFTSDKESERPLVNPDNLCKYLASRGWRRLADNANIYVQIRKQFLIQSGRGDIIRFMSEDMAQEPRKFKHSIMKGIQQLTTHTALQLLPELDVDILKDDRFNSYIPVLNGVIKVNAKGKVLLSYNDIDKYVWKHKMYPWFYTQIPEQQFEAIPFYKFLCCTCSDTVAKGSKLDEERFRALKATIGKMLHLYNDPSNPQAVIFTDAVGWDDTNAGGTGKSLIAQAVSNVRNTVSIECRHKPRNDNFFFDAVVGDVDIIVLDDLDDKVLSFSQIYGYLTGGLEVNRKGEHRVKYSPENTPRFVITTNQAVIGSDISDARRRWDMQLQPHFNLNLKPKDLNNGHNFFEDWQQQEWNELLNIMVASLQYYFESNANVNGCPTYKNTSQERTIRQEISNTMVDWLDNYFSDLTIEHRISLKEFRDKFNEETGMNESRTFKQKLQKWAELRGVQVICKPERFEGKTTEMFTINLTPS